MKTLLLLLFPLAALFGESEDFYQLMGKETPHFRFVSQPKDLAFLQLAKALYEKNEKEQFSEATSYKIPLSSISFGWGLALFRPIS